MLRRLSLFAITAIALLSFAAPALAHHQVPTTQPVYDLLWTFEGGYGAYTLAALSALFVGATLLVKRRRAQD